MARQIDSFASIQLGDFHQTLLVNRWGIGAKWRNTRSRSDERSAGGKIWRSRAHVLHRENSSKSDIWITVFFPWILGLRFEFLWFSEKCIRWKNNFPKIIKFSFLITEKLSLILRPNIHSSRSVFIHLQRLIYIIALSISWLQAFSFQVQFLFYFFSFFFL